MTAWRREFAVCMACLAAVLSATTALGAPQRVLPPEFQGDYQLPQATEPPGRPAAWAIADVAVLVAALAGGTYMALGRRSRGGVLAVMVASLAYFGFFRGGCVCPVGAVQNVSLGLVDASVGVGLVVVAFLVLPLAATLVFGRGFCGSVCPLGAVQDLAVLRPLRVPAWLEHGLGLLAWAVLALTVLLAATGSGYLLCRFDPYVSLFRLAPVGKWIEQGAAGGHWGPASLAGRLEPLVVLAAMLVVGLFVARPFCRYFCPLGAVMRVCSSLAWRRVTITPSNCIRCRLCENACPFGAIVPPAAEVDLAQRRRDRRRLAVLVALLPILAAGGAAGGFAARHALSRANFAVALAERIEASGAGNEPVQAFHAGEESLEELHARANYVRWQFAIGSPLAGGFLGAVVGLKLISLSIRRRRDDWTADPARCLACGRCFASCPIEQQRRKGPQGGQAGQQLAARQPAGEGAC